MANPSGTHQEGNHASSTFNGTNLDNGNSMPQGTGASMKHNPGIAMEWTAQEQMILEDGLTRYASDKIINRYAKVAMQLPNKTVRDVALRCRWMTKKENSKRRKEENLMRKSRDKKERLTVTTLRPANFTGPADASPYVPPMVPVAQDNGLSYQEIWGDMGKLLELNEQAFKQISANLASLKIGNNVDLLWRTYGFITRIMDQLDDTSEVMKQMPPLSVKVNEELLKAIVGFQGEQIPSSSQCLS